MTRRTNRLLTISLVLILLTPLGHGMARADSALPYLSRTKSFSGYNSSVRGDIRTIGMAGATVGLADTFIAATYNPAGLAMALDNADANFANMRVHDNAVQNYASTLYTDNFGACMADYPWGLSLGYVTPYTEGAIYSPASSPSNGLELEVQIRELHLGIARSFMENRFSLGVDMILGRAYELVNPLLDPTQGGSTHSYAVGGTAGAVYKLPDRLLLGLSFSMPMHYAGDTSGQATSALPGFLKPVEVPGRVGLGLGWIPNRYFRADLTTFLIGNTPNTALIRDESSTVGNRATVQPHFGMAYNFSDFREFKATMFLGSYYEVSRIQGAPNRMHATWGVEIHPWLLTIGWGMDTADSYDSYLASVGVDLIRLMGKLDLIPKPWRPAEGGFLPNPFRMSSEGLARPLDPEWRPHGEDLNPFRVGWGIPGKLRDVPEKLPQKLLDTGDDLIDMGQGMLDTVGGLPLRFKELVMPSSSEPKR